MFDIFKQLAEDRIQQAMRNGEFDNLPSRGKPINLDYWASLPQEIRAGYMVLKNGGFVPEEVQLLKEINEFQEQLASCTEPEFKVTVTKKLQETQLKYDLILELKKRKK
ncbi:protein of unknown function (DUF1992) [Desulfosporosinus orientis DSM 765]|uniref:DnaJ homologue subfamily C member 28 conserved domain-containing protein n=1 Tax=Desulfosporosinus orientis (strain ATCC 19365 / DSM 765 / NCIMB 8382 / VKM B-1628 / Singapore I) TaxID=768706 RepID=G7WG07_DESOD|nr:DUF1992 domain-containing protein [Desulfosporosinus orientis]AET69522.1 protein of unknown function (DUF1992) [Desulfosporosinus orientis DSM 765]